MDFDAALDKLEADKRDKTDAATKAAQEKRDRIAAFDAAWNEVAKQVLVPVLDELAEKLRSRGLDATANHSIDVNSGASRDSTLVIHLTTNQGKARCWVRVFAVAGTEQMSVEVNTLQAQGGGSGGTRHDPLAKLTREFLEQKALEIAKAAMR